ncbi:MAG: 30S ribosomal protein S19 [Candidatus Aenigmarchaeota archaeon]|nr:30S ribosomal protein S19 [Candidatus Aenigmarchaeota archaeon]
MAKFMFRGVELEQLKVMPAEEFAKLLKSRQRRHIKRGLLPAQKKLLEDIKKHPDKFHRTHARDMPVLPQMLGAKLGIYSGKEYVPVTIIPEMLGHRLGELVLTRKAVKHSAPGFGATKSSRYVPLK